MNEPRRVKISTHALNNRELINEAASYFANVSPDEKNDRARAQKLFGNELLIDHILDLIQEIRAKIAEFYEFDIAEVSDITHNISEILKTLELYELELPFCSQKLWELEESLNSYLTS